MEPFSTENRLREFQKKGGPFNFNSQKINSILKVGICGEALSIDKGKMKLERDLLTVQAPFRKDAKSITTAFS